MPSPSSPDYALQLVRLYPDDLLNSLVAPDLEALPAQLHCAAGHPQENQPFVLENVHSQGLHFLVFQRAVGERHVDVPAN